MGTARANSHFRPGIVGRETHAPTDLAPREFCDLERDGQAENGSYTLSAKPHHTAPHRAIPHQGSPARTTE